MRAARLTLLAALVAMPALVLSAGSSNGKISGVLTLDGRAAPGIELTLVNLNSGAINRVRSGEGGAFAATLPPGEYAAALSGASRLAVSRAPSRVSVTPGGVSALQVELTRRASTVPATTPSATDSAVAQLLARESGDDDDDDDDDCHGRHYNRRSRCGHGH